MKEKKNNIPQIVIVGYYGFNNLGDEVILACILRGLRKFIPELNITVVSGNPEWTTETYEVSSVSRNDVVGINDAISGADLVILGGGGIFHDYWSFDPDTLLTPEHSGIGFFSGPPLLSALWGKPLMIYSAGVGPLLSESGRIFTRAVFDMATLSTVRDFESKSILESIGLDTSKVYVTADPAFLIDAVDEKRVKDIFKQERCREDKPLLGVSVRYWDIGVSPEYWESQVAQSLDNFFKDNNGSVIFIPFHRLKGQTDDHEVIDRIISRMKHSSKARVLQGFYSPEEIAGILAGCDLVLGMRLHSIILSTAGSVPVVALGYDPKVFNIMKRIGCEDYVIDMSNITADKISHLISEAFNNKERITEKINESRQQLKELAKQDIKMAVDLIENRPAVASCVNKDAQPLFNHLIKGHIRMIEQVASLNDQIEKKGVRTQHCMADMAFQEEMFRNSWKWRIGSVFVEGFILLRDFIRHPLQFIGEAGSRFRRYYNEINPKALNRSKQADKLEEIRQSKIKKAEKLSVSTSLYAGRRDRNIYTKNGRVSIACIFDEFTTACFKPECRLISFRPDNWREVLEQDQPSVVFIESAWRGNEGSWQYRVAEYSISLGDELLELLAWADEKNIPTVFWNKEDPSHFDRFINRAKLFDYVFTTDADCIEKYCEEVGHERVFALPFATQPLIHNPVLRHQREHNVCFAGTYYGGSHVERMQDMELILKPSLNFGLHIYDRQFGMTGPDAAQFRFPDLYQPAIKGHLDYQDMIKAYKNYKVFLNINSVKTSPTMFSRRVFELLACGTPIISTYSNGIEKLLGNEIVLITESEADTEKYLEKLLNNDDYWSGLSVRGIREVMEKHTYNQRLKFIFSCIGMDFPTLNLPAFTIISKIKDSKALMNLQNSLVQQTYRNFDAVLLLENNFAKDDVQRLRNALPDNRIECFPLKSEIAYKGCLRSAQGDYVLLFDAEDYYGANYLKDYALAVMYSRCDLLGKKTHFVNASDSAELDSPGNEFQFVSHVPASTAAVRKNTLNKNRLLKLIENDIFETEGREILSLDRYNYMRLGGGPGFPAGLTDKVEI